jgi:hypothetical protein
MFAIGMRDEVELLDIAELEAVTLIQRLCFCGN